jgi:diketogulonate reductase-like aldo/keto reductase
MRTVGLPSGVRVPVMGQGSWEIGIRRGARRAEIAVIRAGLDLGMTLIDTAEMYGDGSAEEVIGEAIEGRRHEVFLVSKVLPQHATRRGTFEACRRSLKRLRTDYLDLYLLHWREQVPLRETLEGFQELQREGMIRAYGVSNFDVADLEELRGLPGGRDIATNQVLYNLQHRGIEWDLAPWCHQRGLPLMAYSPLNQGRLAGHRKLRSIARRRGASPGQIALAWVLRQPGVFTIPKAATLAHLRQNREALGIHLADEEIEELDAVFPPPREKIPLEIT